MADRIFITGGSGFIGGELVALARAAGFDVAIYDIVAPHFPDHVPLWTQGDVRDAEALRAAAGAFDPHYLLHLASDIDISITRLEQFTTTIDGTRNVIALAGALPALRRFIHVSTQFVVKPGVEPRDEHHLDPYTIYGEAKAETERMLWAADLPVPWFILRPTIIWGPHHPSFAKAIFRHIASGRYLHPRGAAPIERAFGYVRNVARQMLILATLPANATNRHVFYLGDATIDYDVWADAFSKPLAGRPARRVPVWLLELLGRAGDLVKRIGLPSPIDSGRAFRMSTPSAVDLAPTLALTGGAGTIFDDGVGETLDWLHGVDPARFVRR